MDIKPIKNSRDYRRVLKAIEGLMSAKRGTPEGSQLAKLVGVVESWEAKYETLIRPRSGTASPRSRKHP